MKNHQISTITLVFVMLIPVGNNWGGDSTTQQSQPLLPRSVLKLIIDHPVLAPFLHPEVAGRVPVVVSDHLLEPGATPSKFDQPLRVVRDRDVGEQPHLRILSFDMEGSRAKALIEYKVEGVEVHFDLGRDSKGWWTVIDARGIEH